MGQINEHSDSDSDSDVGAISTQEQGEHTIMENGDKLGEASVSHFSPIRLYTS